MPRFSFRSRRACINSVRMNQTGTWISRAGMAFCCLVFLHPAASASRVVEPGLETAVKWKWDVIPSPATRWGLPTRDVPVLATRSTQGRNDPYARDAAIHTVRKGEVLIHIARRHKLTTAQLKEFNSLEADLIHIGQQLRIPNAAERLALRSTPKPSTNSPAPSVPLESEVYLLRVFLDSQGFSSGPISDTPDAVFGKILHRYQTSGGGFLDHQELVASAREAVRTPTSQYELKPADFRFIAPPKAAPAKGAAPPPSYSEMVQSPLLAYSSPWEFVAERFNADEAFLRKLNPSLPAQPPAGSIFLVPNVAPFEIENVPLVKQGALAGNSKTTTRVTDLSVLEILRDGKPAAAMPLSRVRPGLRGSGEWRVLDIVPHPALSTLRESRSPQVEQRSPFYTNPNPTPKVEKPTLTRSEILPPGPNNPLGVAWINLAKEGSTPLPFGIHGSSNPSTVKEIESIGGFRLSNRDIVRAVQLLPPGTPLTWNP